MLLDDEDDNQEKIGMGFNEVILDMYQIDGNLFKTDGYSIFSGCCLINQDEKVRIKIFDNKMKQSFDMGLAEIMSYLHLYEKNIAFCGNGMSKMRDYFYYNVNNLL